mgnify:CR=1 FL=1
MDKMSLRFRIANRILGGMLEQTLTDTIECLDTFLNRLPSIGKYDNYIQINDDDLRPLINGCRILLNYLLMYSFTWKFRIADFIYGRKLRVKIKGIVYRIYDIVQSIKSNEMCLGFERMFDVASAIVHIERIMYDI